MDFVTNLKKYQNFLGKKQIDFSLVNCCDEFLAECSELGINARYLISGFTGTAGDMLVTPQEAYIFVDGRYHIQVDKQVDKKLVKIIKLQLGEKMNDKIIEIIKASKIKSPQIALVSSKISVARYKTLSSKLKKAKFQFFEEDVVCKLFATKKEKNVYKVWNVGIQISGKTTNEKLKELKDYENDFLLVCSNDEICYLANLRSDQNLYSSSFNSIMLVNQKKLLLFSDSNKIPLKVKLNAKNVIFKKFTDFEGEVKKIKSKIYYDETKTPLKYIETLKKHKVKSEEISHSPITIMKSIKNPKEIDYFKKCNKLSDDAIHRTIKNLNSLLKEKKKVYIGDFLNDLTKKAKENGAIGLSFKPILAKNSDSAVIHFTDVKTKEQIKDGDIILLDFGLYFEGGYATDMTRTFVAGNTKKTPFTFKKVYTTVLKAFLNVYNYEITKNTTYFDLDKIARDIISDSDMDGFNFNHSLGHGIGLNVHEAPPTLAPAKSSEKKIRVNTVFSIEPGMYKENAFGIRLENAVYTTKTRTKTQIHTLTHLPFQEELVINEMLSKDEQKWFNDYQEKALK